MDVKCDEGIFLRYSCKSEAYRCLNLSTHKIIESAHMRIEEFAKNIEEERKKEQENSKRFVYSEHNTLIDAYVNKETSSTEPNIVTELQEVPTKSKGKPMLTKSKKPKPEIEIQTKDNRIQSKGKQLVLAKYVRRHHALDQIIDDKSEGTMKISKLKGTCFLADLEPRILKDALENEIWIDAMNE